LGLRRVTHEYVIGSVFRELVYGDERWVYFIYNTLCRSFWLFVWGGLSIIFITVTIIINTPAACTSL